MSQLYKTVFDPKGKFGIWGIGLMVLLGITLLVIPGLFLGKEKAAPAPIQIQEKSEITASSLARLESALALQVSQILSQVEGAGKVAVSLTLDAGYEQDFARNVTNDSSTVEERDTAGGTRSTTTLNQKTEVVFAQGGGNALVTKEIGPKIRGVLIVAEGARDSEVKAKLIRAARALLDVPAHRVLVLPKESR
ncbi:MAG: hypothetical protein QHH10_08570 [Peptococcaceae bacterium]|jgi:stage III sporulation protein AG|nr:hypothetical protein [Peptococcaceae bacterium]MDH7525349.1 hypothetical protein [Peptococcaceae bacterium]